MKDFDIVSKINSYLHSSAIYLAQWLNKLLPRVSRDWWNDCVMDKLSRNQRENAINKGYSKLEDFDLAALLRIADKCWYEMSGVTFLPHKERDCIRDMQLVRNNWAHCGASLPSKDKIISDLNTILDFFCQLCCERKIISDVENTIEEVKSLSASDFEEKSNEGTPLSVAPDAIKPDAIKKDEEIKVNSLVYRISNPADRGIVRKIKTIGNIIKYTVNFNGIDETCYTGQIALVETVKDYNWVDADTLRSSLTAYQINNPAGKNLYSLNSARIDFVPYQFRPALKLIHSDEPKILIADSVGVGKTIEAGLIIKELQARRNLDNIVIVCPKPLVTERKWELEMKRFDEEFTPVTGEELRRVISDTDRDGEWPVKYSKLIIPYSALDGKTYKGENDRRKKAYGLTDLDPAPHFDLVIVDEAHHIRNGGMEKEKAFAYKCVKYFCDHADAVVMLTATPLQTSNDDLFTLLNVLRPDIVMDKATFEMMSRPNTYISHAIRLVRAAEENWQQEAAKELQAVIQTQWGERVICENPSFSHALQVLRQDEVTREERIALISELEGLNSFSTMINRTRRKDIQDFCIRRSYTISVPFTAEQRALHDELLKFESVALTELHGNAQSVAFMMSTIKRQAASCIYGLAPHIRSIIDRRFSQLIDDYDTDYEQFDFIGNDTSVLERIAHKVIEMAENLPEEDTKFNEVLKVIDEKQKQENNKIIIFSTFRHTLKYLSERLSKLGYRVAQVDGGTNAETRQQLRARFEFNKADKDAVDILLFTEVGSEGLDYQFCDTMINYDLPWNPMRIEQRIGRIDRRGQHSEAVNIYNVITEGTIDADIYYRCLMRIGVFENSIGDCDEILGEIATQIDHIATDGMLTEEERKIKLEQMADNEVKKIQELNSLEEQEKELFGIDTSEFMTAKDIHNAENSWLNPHYLQMLTEAYLQARLGNGRYIIGDSDVKQIRLSVDARAAIREDYLKLKEKRNAVGQAWDRYLKGNTPMHAITFESEGARNSTEAFYITAMHPLAKQAAKYFAVCDKLYINLQWASDTVKAGKYYFSVYAWKYVGINPHSKLVMVCDDDSLPEEFGDILQEAISVPAPVVINDNKWELLEEKHIAMWLTEKEKFLAEAESTAAFRQESLNNNFINRKHFLEQCILSADNESIRNMRKRELEKAVEEFNRKMEAIRHSKEQTDIHTSLVANGIIEIKG